MNEIVAPDLTGSDSEKIRELYRYTEELCMELAAELTALRRRVEAVTDILKGGDSA